MKSLFDNSIKFIRFHSRSGVHAAYQLMITTLEEEMEYHYMLVCIVSIRNCEHNNLRWSQPSICIPTAKQSRRTDLNQSYLSLAHRTPLLVLSNAFSGLAYANHGTTRWAEEDTLGSSV